VVLRVRAVRVAGKGGMGSGKRHGGYWVKKENS
jgi:hypothetical protein